MLRVLIVCVVSLALGVESATAVEVAKELAAINAKFSETMRAAEDKRAVYPKASAERTAALEKLTAEAEAEKSTEHRVLSQIYLSLNRDDDAVRQANAALAVDAHDFAARGVLISALTSSGKVDQASEALRALLAVEVVDANAVAFVNAASGAVQTVVRTETTAEKFAAADKFVEEWKAKLDGIKSEDAAVKGAIENAARAVGGMNSMIILAKRRADLIGKAYVPLENPTWLNGEAVSPEQLHGKVVLLDFWAVWCGPCIATFPHLTEWHEKYADKGLVIIGVTQRYQQGWNAEEKRPQVEQGIEPTKEDAATVEFAKHHGLKHRLAVMADASAARSYGIYGIPQVVVIDQNGIVRMIRVGSGPKTADEIEGEIRKLLGLSTIAASN